MIWYKFRSGGHTQNMLIKNRVETLVVLSYVILPFLNFVLISTLEG